MTSIALAAIAVVGFAVGLFVFKVKSRWCRRGGAVLDCPDCGGRRSRPYPGNSRWVGWR